jgi:hypothetical protein
LRGAVTALLASVSLAAGAGTWQPLVQAPPVGEIVDPTTDPPTDLGPGGPVAPVLMTDGGVLVHVASAVGSDPRIFKLTPDINGSYLNGTWSQLASMPYVPYGGAQAVLADGRVLFEGGEYSGYELAFTLTNQGAIYDPVADRWQSVAPPAFFKDLYPPRAVFAPNPIGDSGSVVLPDGRFMLADKMSRQSAILDPSTLSWIQVGTGTKADWNDEEGLTLLPNGKVLTVDCYTNTLFLGTPYPAHPTHSELFDPQTGKWSSAGSTKVTLTDPYLHEMGPAVLRPDGTVFALGSSGTSAIYDSRLGTWEVGPMLPEVHNRQMTAQDAPAALLPNGHVFLAASAGHTQRGNYTNPPVAFLEFDGEGYTIEPTIPNASNDLAQSVNLLLLPTGQVLEVDGSLDVRIYTPDDTEYQAAWAPVIHAVSAQLKRGSSYEITGVRFNGMSQASMFGDEDQDATNYPLVRITNLQTKHVFYSHTHDHSSMAVASPLEVSTHFDVPAVQEPGPSKLEVVANGIASDPRFVTVN